MIYVVQFMCIMHVVQSYFFGVAVLVIFFKKMIFFFRLTDSGLREGYFAVRGVWWFAR